jgi:hypothetical protein
MPDTIATGKSYNELLASTGWFKVGSGKLGLLIRSGGAFKVTKSKVYQVSQSLSYGYNGHPLGYIHRTWRP